MTRAANPVDRIQAEVHRAALHAGPAIAALARAGYAAKGVVYVMIGGLAFLASIGSRADTPGSKGALRTLVDEPYGRVMLTVVAIGLAGYALWCFVRAIFDPERDGAGLKGLGKRVFQFLKGVVHVLLVWAVVDMVRGAGGGSGDDERVRDWTAWLISFPAGVYVVGAIGLGILGYGIRQIHKGWTADLDDQLSLGQMNRTAARWTVHFSRFGMAARGIVFGVSGAFLVAAADQ